MIKRKKSGLHFLYSAMILLLVAGGLTACNRNSNDESPDTLEATAVKLYELRTEYIGDNGKVGGIINALPAIEGMSYDSFSLDTEREGQYSVTVNYIVNPEDYRRRDSKLNIILYENDVPLLKNAILMLSLIDNCDKVYMNFYTESPKTKIPADLLFTRQDAEGLLNGDFLNCSKDYEKFEVFFIRLVNMEIPAHTPNTVWYAGNESLQKVIPPDRQIIVNSGLGSFILYGQDFLSECGMDEVALQSSLGQNLKNYEGKTLYLAVYTLETADTSSQQYTTSPHAYLFDREVLLGYQELKAPEKERPIMDYFRKSYIDGER